jgi:hypothetical protein
LIQALDLIPLMENVARHTATKRGRQALLEIVETASSINNNNKNDKILRKRLSSHTSRRNDWIRDKSMMTSSSSSSLTTKFSPSSWRINPNNNHTPLVSIAQSMKEAQHQYQLIEQATTLLTISNDDDDNDNGNLPWYPPLYGADSSPWDVDTVPQTDDDDWLLLQPQDYTAEHILQAEQVMNMLLQVHQWGQREGIQTMAPLLAQLTAAVEPKPMKEVMSQIQGVVEIVRVRSITDMQGKSTYRVRLKSNQFPVLHLLEQREQELLQNGGKEFDEQVMTIQGEILATTKQIVSGLAQRILGVSNCIGHGLDIVAKLDTILARAAYGISLGGVFPKISQESEIQVTKFIHPVLANTMGLESVVPIDLRMTSQSGEQALIISGPNGGGKSLSMKSFGIVAVLAKLGIPIPVSNDNQNPTVGFFDQILVNIGDHQNLLEGESTWTSVLNSCATIIETVNNNNNNNNHNNKDDKTFLVLLDEFGSAGTDPEACGAVAQAILEEMMAKPCKIVVTTHSPRLKALSFEQSNIGCAAVLLEKRSSSRYQLPSFKLEYGIIGESYALGAASRTKPSLPSSVLARAAELMSNNDGETEEATTHKNYIQALTSSMEEQLERTKRIAESNEELEVNLLRCRQAMMSLAGSYNSHLERQLERLEGYFRNLKTESTNQLELIGETIGELKLVRKKITSQQERLAQQGLRVLPIHYSLSPGESVVILTSGEWEGMTAIVVSDVSTIDTPLLPNEVLVRPSFSLHAWDDVMMSNLDPMAERPLILQRHELAIWEYDGAIDDSYKSKPVTSISDSKSKVDSLLATINSVSTKQKTESAQKASSYQSSRERKAANKGKRKRK